VAGHTPLLSEPAAETLAAGGKRLRPLLVFCSAPRDALESDALVNAACSVELVHMATLVHDDIIDQAVMRRGRPTVAQAQGPDAALRVGDFLFARAFSELARAGQPRAVQALSESSLDLSRGELLQQAAEHDLDLTEAAYTERCWGKTASLFAVSCRLGAMVGGADREVEDRVAAFGEHVGLAFQIFDDILDLTGDPAKTGKRRGADLRDGTVTLPVILAMQDDPSMRRRVAEVGGDDASIEELCDELAYVAAAREAVSDVDTVATKALLAIADGVVDRYA
jgi:octaprenyl-diphosphate synthase